MAPRFPVALVFASAVAVAEISVACAPPADRRAAAVPAVAATTSATTSATTRATPSAPSGDAFFRSEIRPILAARCAPCHEPGGKLYAKLPFDDPAVLASHVPGVTKRLKGDDRKAFERWIAMTPANPGTR